MSLIHTAELNHVAPFEYLVALQRHSNEVAAHPADWMPWNYQATLASQNPGPEPPRLADPRGGPSGLRILTGRARIIVTSGRFTKNAENFAHGRGIELVPAEQFLAEVRSHVRRQ